MSRPDDLFRFYELIDNLRHRVGGLLTLHQCHGRLDWPKRGVYFFFEQDENRTDSGTGPRVVRVGTHALKEGSATTLWKRLSQHAGVKRSGAGNHRGSIFRLLVGEALMVRDATEEPASWGIGSHPGEAGKKLGQSAEQIRASEHSLEHKVSLFIGAMPFVFVAAEDLPGPDSERGIIERNSIALLSNFRGNKMDAASRGWLGRQSGRERVRGSGLWNNNYVDEDYDPCFFDTLARAIEHMGGDR